MEIVKYGHMKPEELTCRNCGAVLAYTIQDVKSKIRGKGVFIYVICPVCGQPTVIEALEE